MTTQAEGPNHELFVKVLAQIEREPQTWDQTMWRNTEAKCGTSCCFAGWAATIDGRSAWLIDERANWDDYLHATAEEIAAGISDRLLIERFKDVEIVSTSQRAVSVLGISEQQASLLFNPVNTLADLYEISARILGIDEQVLRDKVAEA